MLLWNAYGCGVVTLPFGGRLDPVQPWHLIPFATHVKVEGSWLEFRGSIANNNAGRFEPMPR
jgi:hypothetical protein